MAATTTFPFLPTSHRPRLKLSARSTHLHFKPTASSSSASWEREEARWLREEHRWLREEQRWLREEARWRAERDALLEEIASLRRRVQALEPLAGAGAAVGALAAPPSPPRPALVEEADVKEMVLEEVRVHGLERGEEATAVARRRTTLRVGSEGEDVRAMQEALEKLGFYSGEEDMEFSSFSTGTERAVKTWQASQGTAEDGVMTSDLLEMLFAEQAAGGSRAKDGVNGAAVASVAKIADVQQTVVKETGDTEVEAYQHRVFLIGENRWEEPSRLAQKNRPTSSTGASAKKCISCRGEGRLMCTECDGSGEPNIEPQFLEWVGEDMKCPYCEGLGYTVCDVCDGKAVVQT